jgi:hypothetical protein
VTIVAHAHPFVIGVDTHARTHTLAVLVAATGELVATEQFPATDAGMSRAVAWAARRTGGDLATLWVIEGVATYGAHLASAVTRAGYEVVEAGRMDARAHRGTGKSDPLDARRIAAAALSLEPGQLRRPRRDDGVRAALRILVTAREHMTTERTATVTRPLHRAGLLHPPDLDLRRSERTCRLGGPAPPTLGAPQIPGDAVQLQLAFVVGPLRNWLTLWKPTIDALDPLLVRTREDRDWDPRHGLITDLGLPVRVDASLGHDVKVSSAAAPADGTEEGGQ